VARRQHDSDDIFGSGRSPVANGGSFGRMLDQILKVLLAEILATNCTVLYQESSQEATTKERAALFVVLQGLLFGCLSSRARSLKMELYTYQ